MDRLLMWLMWLGGSYVFTAMALVMLGQSVRPVGHLLKATTFWFLFSVAGVLFIFFVLVPLL